MAETTLDPKTARENRDVELQRRLDDMVPVLTEALAQIHREDRWKDVAAQYDDMAAAQERCDRECEAAPDDPITDAVWTAVVGAKLEAENKLIETPAPNGAALVRKLELLVEDGGNVPTERLALLLKDAKRLFA